MKLFLVIAISSLLASAAAAGEAAKTKVTFTTNLKGKSFTVRLYRKDNEDKTERPMASFSMGTDGEAQRSVPQNELIRVAVDYHGYKHFSQTFRTRPGQATFTFRIGMKKN